MKRYWKIFVKWVRGDWYVPVRVNYGIEDGFWPIMKNQSVFDCDEAYQHAKDRTTLSKEACLAECRRVNWKP